MSFLAEENLVAILVDNFHFDSESQDNHGHDKCYEYPLILFIPGFNFLLELGRLDEELFQVEFVERQGVQVAKHKPI